MAQETSAINQALHQTQETLEHFKTLVKTEKDHLSEKQVSSVLKELKEQLDGLKKLENDAKAIGSATPKQEADFTSSEKKIFEAIAFLQKDPHTKDYIGNIGNIKTSLTLFLNQVKEQIVRIEKKRKKVDPAEKSEFGNL